MKTNNLSTIALITVALFCGPVYAGISIDPGLWQMTMQIKSGSEEMEQTMKRMQEQINSIPPSSANPIEKRLTAQSSDAPEEDSDQVFHMCVSPEMATQFEMPMQQTGNCKSEFKQDSEDIIRVSYTCDDPPSTGEGTIVLEGKRFYSAQMTISTQQEQRSEEIVISYQGKWIAQECGNIKPPIALNQ